MIVTAWLPDYMLISLCGSDFIYLLFVAVPLVIR